MIIVPEAIIVSVSVSYSDGGVASVPEKKGELKEL